MSIFNRMSLLLSKEKIDFLNQKHVAVFGLGGVGGVALETLARCGIEHFTLIDKDTFEETNLNRQILALHSNLGKKKVEEAQKHLLDINPKIKTHLFTDTITLETDFPSYFTDKIDFILDCIDFIPGKVALIKYALDHHIPFLSSMGAGWKIDCRQVKIVPFRQITGCPIAKKLRKELKETSCDFMCIASLEQGGVRKSGSIGSFMPVTAMFGLLGADYIIHYLIKE